MDLNVTAFVTAYADCMERFSSSIAESGLQNIGQITWRNALKAMDEPSNWLCADLDALVDHFADYGAWERAELESMSGLELNALLVQFVAGEYQQHAADENRVMEWERLFESDDGQWFYTVGT